MRFIIKMIIGLGLVLANDTLKRQIDDQYLLNDNSDRGDQYGTLVQMLEESGDSKWPSYPKEGEPGKYIYLSMQKS